MLVLSRRVGERLLIGDDVVITVIEVRSDGVRLGIEAPREIRVHRAEVLEAVRRSNVEAVGADEATEAALRRLVIPAKEGAAEPSDEGATGAPPDAAPAPPAADPAPPPVPRPSALARKPTPRPRGNAPAGG
ncbi:MAG: carbon storage regulator CsrA [Actinobacteria bacterium]|nr:carbon storage regulator CsrA [Actinomycetota bacterium]